MKINGNANGFVGQRTLSLDLSEQNQTSKMDGSLGEDSVHVSQHDDKIEGTVFGPSGSANLNINVKHSGQKTQLSGWMGRNPVSIEDTLKANGEHNIRGSVGEVDLNLTRKDQGSTTSLKGSAHFSSHGSQSVQVTLNGASHIESLYPVLAFLGPSLNLAMEGLQTAPTCAN